MSVLLCLAPLLPLTSACDGIHDGIHVESLGASWMEWPAEVPAVTAFDVRIVGFLPTCGSTYVRRYSIDQANSAVVFTPYAIVPDEPPCVNVAPAMFQDTITLAGLTEGTYEIRTPGRVFGELSVRADPVGASRLDAAGQASVARDQGNCLRLMPAVWLIVRPLPLENPPPDTSASGTAFYAFVTGYLYDAPAPICGESKVFHLVTRN